MYVRAGYVLSQAITLGIYYYMSQKVRAPFHGARVHLGVDACTQIKAKNDQTVLKYGT